MGIVVCSRSNLIILEFFLGILFGYHGIEEDVLLLA